MLERRALLTMVLLSPLVVAAQAADVTGNWRVTISTSDGTVTREGVVKADGRHGDRLGGA
jgi:hypothetical protein